MLLKALVESVTYVNMGNCFVNGYHQCPILTGH